MAGPRRRICDVIDLKFTDSSARQICERIQDAMQGSLLARTVVVETVAGQTVVGTYEQISGRDILIEVEESSQLICRVPCSQVTRFREYQDAAEQRR